MTDEELAQAVKEYDFSTNDAGDPRLPPQTTPLGKRLHGALVSSHGAVQWQLGPKAQAALLAKGFTLATSTDGREKTGLDPLTLRAGGTRERPMTDRELAQAVKEYDFSTNDAGDPLLPPRWTPLLGRRLHGALVDSHGAVPTELGPKAQAALEAKGFTLAISADGRRTGLHSDTPRTPRTPRTGGTHQRPMTDKELAQAVKEYDFSTNDAGDPLLPPQTTPLGKRLHGALVSSRGVVKAELGPKAQAALEAKGFTLATSTDGREKTGLHSDTPRTPRAGGTHQPRGVPVAAAAAAGPMRGGPGPRPASPALPRVAELDGLVTLWHAAAKAGAASRAGGPGQPTPQTPLPPIPVPGSPLTRATPRSR
ncbi:hypothetical protein OG215_39660 (plasmid) [Streptomyces globisporus]|uniref:hypothetical protein n=1 Tax=Streptomyces globisporus TaxID=1908 RepID=UPI003866D6C5|nr:hypothetical protein OG215_39660 [Streptomyces globisporus]